MALRNPTTGVPRAREAEHKPIKLRRRLDCGSAGAEMLKLALRNQITGAPRATGAPQSDHSSLRLRAQARKCKTGAPQSGPIAVAESPTAAQVAETLKLALRSPIMVAPRAREAAAQTPSCGGILTAETQARRC